MLFRGKLAHEVAHALVTAQVGRARQAAGKHDVVIVVEIDLFEGAVAGDFDLLRAYGIASRHGRHEGDAHAASPKHIDHREAFDCFKSIGNEHGDCAHRGSLHTYASCDLRRFQTTYTRTAQAQDTRCGDEPSVSTQR